MSINDILLEDLYKVYNELGYTIVLADGKILEVERECEDYCCC